MSNIIYTSAFQNGDSVIITPEVLDKFSKVCCLHCGSKNIDLGNVHIEKGKLTIEVSESECSRCNLGDGEFVDDNVYIECHKLQCKEDYIINKKHRD